MAQKGHTFKLKRLLLQIKNDKSCARIMKDKTWFESHDLAFSLHLCWRGKERDSSWAFLMMFCLFCGEKCVTAAIFCHKCGKMISSSMDKEKVSSSGVQKTSERASKPLLTFATFRSRKDWDDRSEYLKPSAAKRLKKEPERVEREVKVQVGIVRWRTAVFPWNVES